MMMTFRYIRIEIYVQLNVINAHIQHFTDVPSHREMSQCVVLCYLHTDKLVVFWNNYYAQDVSLKKPTANIAQL